MSNKNIQKEIEDLYKLASDLHIHLGCECGCGGDELQEEIKVLERKLKDAEIE